MEAYKLLDRWADALEDADMLDMEEPSAGVYKAKTEEIAMYLRSWGNTRQWNDGKLGQMVLHVCPLRHQWYAGLYFELGGWFYLDEDMAACPRCGDEADEQLSLETRGIDIHVG